MEKQTSILINLDEDLKKTIKTYCLENDITMTEFILNLVIEKLVSENKI